MRGEKRRVGEALSPPRWRGPASGIQATVTHRCLDRVRRGGSWLSPGWPFTPPCSALGRGKALLRHFQVLPTDWSDLGFSGCTSAPELSSPHSGMLQEGCGRKAALASVRPPYGPAQACSVLAGGGTHSGGHSIHGPLGRSSIRIRAMIHQEIYHCQLNKGISGQ